MLEEEKGENMMAIAIMMSNKGKYRGAKEKGEEKRKWRKTMRNSNVSISTLSS